MFVLARSAEYLGNGGKARSKPSLSFAAQIFRIRLVYIKCLDSRMNNNSGMKSNSNYKRNCSRGVYTKGSKSYSE